jgi:hypothetical protein
LVPALDPMLVKSGKKTPGPTPCSFHRLSVLWPPRVNSKVIAELLLKVADAGHRLRHLLALGTTSDPLSPSICRLWEEIIVAWSQATLGHRRKTAQWRHAHPRGAHAPVSYLTGGATADSHRRSLCLFLSTGARSVKGAK